MLGVKAVIAESFERIHRSNLIGMGVLPLVFQPGESRATLGLTGDEIVDIALPDGVDDPKPRQDLILRVRRADDSVIETSVRSCLDTATEIDYFKCGGILQYVLNRRLEAA